MPANSLALPSSSKSKYASNYVHRYIQAVLSSAGFSKSSSQSIDLLAEIFERYLLLIGNTAQEKANGVGRITPNAWDIESALRDLGSGVDDIQEWIANDGVEIGGQFGTEETLETEPISSLYSGVEQLEESLKRGKSDTSQSGPLKMYYEDVSPAQAQTLSELLVKDEERNDEEADDEDDDAIASSSSSHLPHTPTLPSYRKRLQEMTITESIFPDFLPPFPGQMKEVDSKAVIEDAEYAQEILRRQQKGEERSLTTAAKDPDVEIQPLGVHSNGLSISEQIAEQPKRSAEELWGTAISYASSTLASAQIIEDIPEITLQGLPLTDGQSSSMHAFAHDYPELVREARSAGKGYLTPNEGAHAKAFHQRRAMAAFLTDPMKYTPCDTAFGSISARPTALPFNPQSSLLITPPNSNRSAPDFTPINPNGRNMPSSSVFGNALYPTCRHRAPNNVMYAARLLSGGIGSETYRRMTRIHDPEPLLDDQHAERVFHGQPAPKELLVESHSFLRGALDMLKVKRMEEKRAMNGDAADNDEDEDAMDTSTGINGVNGNGIENKKALRDRMNISTKNVIKVKGGTIVSTWDWITRDSTDSTLIGKRFRPGTEGVVLGGPSVNLDEGEESNEKRFRSRSQSFIIAEQ